MFSQWQRAQQGIREANKLQGAIEPTDQKTTITGLRPEMIHAWQFFVLDVGLPFVLFLTAAITAYLRIVAYWPQCDSIIPCPV